MHLKVRPQQGRRSESKECSHKGRTVVSGSQIHSPQYGRGRTWNIQLGVIIYTTKRLIQIVLWLAFFKILDRLAWSVLWRKLNSDKALDKSSMEWEWLHNISFSECFSFNKLVDSFQNLRTKSLKIAKTGFHLRNLHHYRWNLNVFTRVGICHSRHSRRECKYFASSVNFSRNNAIYNRNERTKYILYWFHL